MGVEPGVNVRFDISVTLFTKSYPTISNIKINDVPTLMVERV